eukprot:7380842-Prymnesium_polylepis.3
MRWPICARALLRAGLHTLSAAVHVSYLPAVVHDSPAQLRHTGSNAASGAAGGAQDAAQRMNSRGAAHRSPSQVEKRQSQSARTDGQWPTDWRDRIPTGRG